MNAEPVFELERPDRSTRAASERLEHAVERAIGSLPQGGAVLVVGDEHVEVPLALLHALLHTVHEQAAGRRVRLIAPDAEGELTPNRAAAYLGISRPLLVKLLDDGAIPSRTLPGSRHRRIAVADLEAYQTGKSRRRRRVASAMNEVADAGLYLPKD